MLSYVNPATAIAVAFSVQIYSVIAILFIFIGTTLSNDLVWELSDFFNYLMVIPNVIALIALYKVVVKNSKN